jgi:hypothetical protein
MVTAPWPCAAAVKRAYYRGTKRILGSKFPEGYSSMPVSVGVLLLQPTRTPTWKRIHKKENELSDEDLSQFYPRFNAFVYSLETFVPFLKLWMSGYWAPNATRLNCLKVLKRQLPITGRRLRFYLWVHVAAGWVLTTLWVGGLTGLLKT